MRNNKNRFKTYEFTTTKTRLDNNENNINIILKIII